jgi:hypothetical protein
VEYPGHTVKIGEADRTIVRAVRGRLRELQLAADSDGPFDLELARVVKLFQSRNVDNLGRTLMPDGKVGPLTWAALFAISTAPVVRAPGPLTQRAMEIATSQIGVRESPTNSNRGPEVESFLAAVGLGPGHAWCAAFVYWCLKQAAAELDMRNSCLRSGGVLRQWKHAVEEGIPRISATAAKNDPSLVQPGMVLVIDWGSGLGHTGFLTRVQGGHFETVEGNTDGSRTREGGGVYALTRKVGEINKGYVLYD